MTEDEQTSKSRRDFLKMVGGASALWFGGRFAMVHDFRGDFSVPAYDYWRQSEKGSFTDLEYMVMCGILAANPHNSQPWRFKLGENRIDVFADHSRNLGTADLNRRMMRIGVGCAIDNIEIAASKLGYQAKVTLDANAKFEDNGHCATIELTQGGSASPLFPAIFQRQTTRSLYSMGKPVPDDYRTTLDNRAQSLGLKMFWSHNSGDRLRISFLNRQASMDWVGNHQRHVDGMKWFRLSREEWYEKRDGLSMFTGAPNLMGKFFVNRFGTEAERYTQLWKDVEVELTVAQSDNTPMWGLIHADREDSDTLVNGGRLLERAYLEAIDRNLRLSPVCYATELPKQAARLINTLSLPGDTVPISLFRVGYGPLLERSVRRDIKDVIVS